MFVLFLKKDFWPVALVVQYFFNNLKNGRTREIQMDIGNLIPSTDEKAYIFLYLHTLKIYFSSFIIAFLVRKTEA